MSRCDGNGRMVCSAVVIVCHMRGKASAGVPVVGSIASRSLMSEIKLLTCRFGSRDVIDTIQRPANGKTSYLCAKEPISVGASSK